MIGKAFFLYCVQFFDRLKLFGMPAKHQPDFIYLRHVPLRKVHLFTIIQLSCLVLLWVIKTSRAAIVFPMMVKKDTYIDIYIVERERKRVVCCNSDMVSVFMCVFVCVQVLALVFIRKLLDFIFTKRELSWLDDLMPESKKKKLEDAQQEVLCHLFPSKQRFWPHSKVQSSCSGESREHTRV